MTNKGATNKKTTNKETTNNWSNVSGIMVVWGKEIEYGRGKNKNAFMSYSTSIGRKKEDGSYDNIYFNVLFKRDEDIGKEGATTIDIKEAFMTVTTDNKGNKYPAIMILDYEVI